MPAWLQDYRYGARMLVKRPGTSAIAIVALALGIGLTTTMFSIVEGVMLRGLPFDDSQRIVFVGSATKANAAQPGAASQHDYLDWRERQRSFEQIAGYSTTGFTLGDEDGFPEQIPAARITTNLLALLRLKPAIGRDFTEADAVPGAPLVALISHATWTRRFAADPQIFGRAITLNRTPATIVGVMPERFGFPESQHLWVPHPLSGPPKRGEGARLMVIGRLREDVSLARAQSEMTGIATQLADAHVENRDVVAVVMPFLQRFVPARIRTTFLTMLGAVLGVMLIACVNVTNLQLARAAERAKEFAVRTALGSGRWRIVRQSLAEGLLLSTIGALVGIALAQAGVQYFMYAIADTRPPFWIDVRLDLTVLAFVSAITILSALVSSVVPGLRVARADANAVLKDDSRGTTSLRMGRFSRWLVVVEVTVSCVLLVVSGLMIRSILSTSRLDYPFATRDVFHATVGFDSRQDRSASDVVQVVDEMQARVARLPGVRHVSLSTSVPGNAGSRAVSVEGEPPRAEGETTRPTARHIAATPGFFPVLGVSALQGRLLAATDVAGTEPVTVVDEAFVARFLAGGAPLGRRVRFADGDEAERAPWVTVVGVVPTLTASDQDVRGGQSGDQGGSAYVPFAQSPQYGVTILARTTGDPLALTNPVRQVVKQVSDQSPVGNVNSLAGMLWQRGWAFRLFGGLFLLFGAAALLLAAAGLYGVMSFTVRRRTQEIGVRMALGASRGGVLGMVLWQGLWRVALAVALGLWPGWLVARQMQALLANVPPFDTLVYVTTAVTLIVAGGLATLAPALRASSVDPLTALRRD